MDELKTIWIPGKAADLLLPHPGVEVVDDDHRGSRRRFLVQASSEALLKLKDRAREIASGLPNDGSWVLYAVGGVMSSVDEALEEEQALGEMDDGEFLREMSREMRRLGFPWAHVERVEEIGARLDATGNRGD